MIAKNKIVLALLLCSAVVVAATIGDQHPFAKYGTSQVSGYDGGTGSPVCIGASNQNSVMVRNLQLDGGAGATLYCGFDTSVTQLTGMPIQTNETLTVDMVALTGALPMPLDGGLGTVSPKLCCIGAPGSNPADLHYMIVK